MIMIRTVPNIMKAFGCSADSAQRCIDLRDEGHGREQAKLMAGLADPPDPDHIAITDPHAGVQGHASENPELVAAAAAQTARAFQIADRSEFELLQSEGVPIDSRYTTLSFTDESCNEVTSLADASPALREAFEWLRDRGYVALGSDETGEFVNVLRRPGEE